MTAIDFISDVCFWISLNPILAILITCLAIVFLTAVFLAIRFYRAHKKLKGTLDETTEDFNSKISVLKRESNNKTHRYQLLQNELREVSEHAGNLQTEKERAISENSSLKEQLEEVTGRSEDFRNQIGSLTSSYNSLSQQYNLLKEENETAVQQIGSLTISYNSLSQQYNLLKEENETAIQQITQMDSQISERDNSLEQTLAEKNRLEVKNEELSSRIRSLQGHRMNHVMQIRNLSSELEEYRNQNESLQRDLATLRESCTNLINEKSSLLSQIESHNSMHEERICGLNEEIDSLRSDLDHVKTTKTEEMRAMELQIQENEETIQNKVRIINELENEIREKESEIESITTELQHIRTEKDSQTEKIQNLENSNAVLKNDYDALAARFHELEEELSSLQSEKERQEPKTDQPKEEDEPKPGKKAIPGIEDKPEAEPTPPFETENPTPVLHVPQKSDEGQEIEISQTGNAHHIHKKKREEEIVEQCGDSIINFPPILNDSDHDTQRTIQYVFDDNNNIVHADEFFRKSPETIAQVSRKMAEAEISGTIYWTCGLCRRRVKIAHRTCNGKESIFFIHANRDHECPWITKSTFSKDKKLEDEIISYDSDYEDKVTKNTELKEKIYSLLTSPVCAKMGISDVKMDEIIRSKVPYMRWRRPDISFELNGKKMVIVLQKKSHDLDTIVDRDIFFRLNNIQILWVFGSESDTSYEYMRKLNYKNTMFDNHRNVFVFDKDAQNESEETETLCLKCNWLDKDDSWKYTVEKTGQNGKIVHLNELTYDEEYCKPYYYDANEDYFQKHPEARVQYLATKKSREELMKDIEEKWTRDSSYEEAQAQMSQRQQRATVYCVRGLWGFRFNTTVIIPPIFTEEPQDLSNGYYLVQQGANLGIVDYHGKKVISWDGHIVCDDMNYDPSFKRVYFAKNQKWGVANRDGEVLIEAKFQAIQKWDLQVFRVKLNDKWGLYSIDNGQITDYKYNRIDELVDSKASAIKDHPVKKWMTVKGYIDKEGKEIFTSRREIGNGYSLIESFELWGIENENGEIVVPCQYDEIKSWCGKKLRVKEVDKWGIINLEDLSITLPVKYDFIGELYNGAANTKLAQVETMIDAEGKEVAQECIPLQNGFKKTKIANKWGIVNDNGDILINHSYDEIGSFRSRLIGVINNKIIKLNVNYPYPIYVTGKLIKSTIKNHLFSIAGVECVLPASFPKMVNKTIGQLCDTGNECKQLAFSNLIFSQQKYILRILNPENLSHRLSHADSQDDFILDEALTGKILSFKSYAKKGVKRRTKAMVEFPDGRRSMIPKRFFKTSMTIEEYNINDSITVKKVGFDDELDQTIWEVL